MREAREAELGWPWWVIDEDWLCEESAGVVGGYPYFSYCSGGYPGGKGGGYPYFFSSSGYPGGKTGGDAMVLSFGFYVCVFVVGCVIGWEEQVSALYVDDTMHIVEDKVLSILCKEDQFLVTRRILIKKLGPNI